MERAKGSWNGSAGVDGGTEIFGQMGGAERYLPPMRRQVGRGGADGEGGLEFEEMGDLFGEGALQETHFSDGKVINLIKLAKTHGYELFII